MISVVVISRDEPAIEETLTRIEAEAAPSTEAVEVLVVDASRGRLDHVRAAHPRVRWIDYEPPAGVDVSIPHQRNAGVDAARGELIVFTDAGCMPRAGWLEALCQPLREAGEQVVAGPAFSPEGDGLYDTRLAAAGTAGYLEECPTINLAFLRLAYDAVGGFDEHFEYGSDIDFSWRLREAGFAIRSAPDAVVTHDWGPPGRQLRRSFRYGRARARLYGKHRRRLTRAWRSDPMVLVYPLFLLGLPLTVRFRAYPLLLVLPAWRNRDDGSGRVLADHLVFGLGVLRELVPR